MNSLVIFIFKHKKNYSIEIECKMIIKLKTKENKLKEILELSKYRTTMNINLRKF